MRTLPFPTRAPLATRSAAIVASLLLASASAVGCAAHFETVDGEDAVYVDAAPTNIEVYPHYAFQDGYVYDVNGRWYHRHGNRWVVYRERPHAIHERVVR